MTVVFCDVAGSTALGERLDPESTRRVMSRFFERMRSELEAHGGTVEKFIGDAVMAVFGVPVLHEDDPVRAVRAAAGMRMALDDLNGELERSWGVTLATRIGVNTGEVVVGRDSAREAIVVGDAVNVAARLEQAAGSGEILIGVPTYRLVRHAVTAEPVEPLALKGKTEPVAAYRLIGVAEYPAPARRFDAPLVGRSRELRMLADAYEHAAADAACHLVSVLGAAGVGKSRLVTEAVASLSPRTQVLTGRCLPYGDGITFWAVGEIVKGAAGITEADTGDRARSKVAALVNGEPDENIIAQSVGELIGLAPPGASLEQGFWATRKLLEALARSRPLVVTFDDLQWAEPTLLDLIEHIADWSRDAPIVLMCMARPEFLELRPGWGGGKVNALSMLLEPLSAAEAEELVANLLPHAELPSSLRSRILEAAAGNPLFLEETLSNLIEDGRLLREGDAWHQVGEVDRVDVPPTIHALLAARLDRLGREELTVIEGASVVGQVFYRGAVSELAPEALRPDVGTYLLSLVRKDLIRPDPSALAGEEAFRFRHLLIRDAAYQAMPKQTRAELHERFARWLQRTAGDRLPEYEEIVGYHLEQAHRYRMELGPEDDRARRLSADAGRALGRAGERAELRSDFAAAISLLHRATGLLPPWDEVRIRLLLVLSRAHHDARDTEGAQRALNEAVECAKESGDAGLVWHARLAQERFRYFTGEWDAERARRLVHQAIPDLEALGDDHALATAWRLLASIETSVGHFEAWGVAAQRAAEHARRAGDRNLEVRAMVEVATAMTGGPALAEDALRWCVHVRRSVDLEPDLECAILQCIAVLNAVRGDFDQARELLVEAEAIVGRLRNPYHEMLLGESTGHVESLAGDWIAAEHGFRRAIQAHHGWLVNADMAMDYSDLVRVLLAEDRLEEAKTFVAAAERLPGHTDLTNASWQSANAELLLRADSIVEAMAMALDAVDCARRTDIPELRGEALMTLAGVMVAAGQQEDALRTVKQALAEYERKGNVVLAARTRAALEAISRT